MFVLAGQHGIALTCSRLPPLSCTRHPQVALVTSTIGVVMQCTLTGLACPLLLSTPCWVCPQYVPSIYVILSTAIIVVLQQWSALPFLYLGTYSSWVYLRFFQQQPESTARGDPSEEFKFSSFFPDVLAGPIDLVAGVLGRVTRLQHGAAGEAKPLLPVAQTALGSNSADANRRR